MVKESFDVCLQHPVDFSSVYCILYYSYYIVSTPSRSESVGTVQKPWLVCSIQYVCHDTLYQPVLIAGYTQWTILSIAFRYVYPSYGLWLILKPFHPHQQIADVFIKVLAIGILTNAVYAFCFSLLLPLMGFPKAVRIDIVHDALYLAEILRLVTYFLHFILHYGNLSCYLLFLTQKATILYPLHSTCFHRFHHYYEVIRLLTGHL